MHFYEYLNNFLILSHFAISFLIIFIFLLIFLKTFTNPPIYLTDIKTELNRTNLNVASIKLMATPREHLLLLSHAMLSQIFNNYRYFFSAAYLSSNFTHELNTFKITFLYKFHSPLISNMFIYTFIIFFLI